MSLHSLTRPLARDSARRPWLVVGGWAAAGVAPAAAAASSTRTRATSSAAVSPPLPSHDRLPSIDRYRASTLTRSRAA